MYRHLNVSTCHLRGCDVTSSVNSYSTNGHIMRPTSTTAVALSDWTGFCRKKPSRTVSPTNIPQQDSSSLSSRVSPMAIGRPLVSTITAAPPSPAPLQPGRCHANSLALHIIYCLFLYTSGAMAPAPC